MRAALDGSAEILLITSRETRRWVIPKGWPMKGRTAAEVAMIEAFEEAGIEGEILGSKPIGTYRYLKLQLAGRRLPVRVDVFPMLVTAQLEDWPEKGQRAAAWFSPFDAAGMVAEPSLAKIIRKVDVFLRRRAKKADSVARLPEPRACLRLSNPETLR